MAAGRGPNGLRFTRAAAIDREYGWAESGFQNRADLGAAKRRRVQARVGPSRARDLMSFHRSNARCETRWIFPHHPVTSLWYDGYLNAMCWQ